MGKSTPLLSLFTATACLFGTAPAAPDQIAIRLVKIELRYPE
jgi:hypothetical protein